MDDDEQDRRIIELDRLLNDPTVPMRPDLIWSLALAISECGSMSAAVEAARHKN